MGHANPQKALSDHVPEGHREILETLSGGYGLSVPAGREWRRDLKQWAAEVIETVQQEGIRETQRAALSAQQTIALAMERIADRLDSLVLERPSHTADLAAQPTTEARLYSLSGCFGGRRSGVRAPSGLTRPRRPG